jgi:predicted DNA-binding transcriptional regulator YafY
MTATEKFNLVKRACDEKKVCEVKYTDNRAPRNIQPLGICLTYKRTLVIVCWSGDVGGTVRNQEAVTNLPIEDCENIKILEKNFQVPPGTMANAKICEDWIFRVS